MIERPPSRSEAGLATAASCPPSGGLRAATCRFAWWIGIVAPLLMTMVGWWTMVSDAETVRRQRCQAILVDEMRQASFEMNQAAEFGQSRSDPLGSATRMATLHPLHAGVSRRLHLGPPLERPRFRLRDGQLLLDGFPPARIALRSAAWQAAATTANGHGPDHAPGPDPSQEIAAAPGGNQPSPGGTPTLTTGIDARAWRHPWRDLGPWLGLLAISLLTITRWPLRTRNGAPVAADWRLAHQVGAAVTVGTAVPLVGFWLALIAFGEMRQLATPAILAQQLDDSCTDLDVAIDTIDRAWSHRFMRLAYGLGANPQSDRSRLRRFSDEGLAGVIQLLPASGSPTVIRRIHPHDRYRIGGFMGTTEQLPRPVLAIFEWMLGSVRAGSTTGIAMDRDAVTGGMLLEFVENTIDPSRLGRMLMAPGEVVRGFDSTIYARSGVALLPPDRPPFTPPTALLAVEMSRRNLWDRWLDRVLPADEPVWLGADHLIPGYLGARAVFAREYLHRPPPRASWPDRWSDGTDGHHLSLLIEMAGDESADRVIDRLDEPAGDVMVIHPLADRPHVIFARATARRAGGPGPSRPAPLTAPHPPRGGRMIGPAPNPVAMPAWRLAGVAAYALLLVAAVVSVFTRKLVGPVTVLSAAVARVEAGRLDFSVRLDTGDEFGQVAVSFDAMLAGIRERERMARFVSSEVVAAVSDEAVDAAGERRECAILFAKPRNFTALTGSDDPERVARRLSLYFSLMGWHIRRHGGVIDKFIGEAIMARFDHQSPRAGGHPAARAAAAAIAMQRAREGFDRFLAGRGEPGSGLGIGINLGSVIVGRVGSRHGRLDFTAIGDAVNVAARLEGIAGSAPSGIAIAGSVAAHLPQSLPARRLGELPLKGRSQPMSVHALELPG